MDNLREDRAQLELDQEQMELDNQYLQKRKAQDEKAAAEEAQLQQEAENPPTGAGEEARNAVVGGAAQAVSDVFTLPERMFDMFNGQMEEEGKDYKPEVDPFQPDQFETKSWWGTLLGGAVTYGLMALPVGKGLKAVGMGSKFLAGTGLASRVGRSVATGAGVSLLQSQSQGDNMAAQMRDKYGWIDTPLATKDSDHPAVKTFKNVAENIGFDIIGDTLFELLGAGAKAIFRNDNIKGQYDELAKSRKLPEGETRVETDPYETPALKTDTQGNVSSTADGPSITRQLDQIDNTMGGDYGSTDSPLTQRQLERMSSGADGESTKVIKELIKEYRDSDAYKQEIRDLRAGRKSLADIRANGIRRFNEIAGNPRDLEQLDVDALLKESQTNRIGGIEVLQPEDVLVYDMLTGGLAKQIRDLGIAGREVAGYADMGEKGGVIDSMKEKLTSLMIATKRSRYMTSTALKGFDATTSSTKRAAEVKKAMKDIDDSTKKQIETMFSIFEEDPNGELFEAFLEAISMSNKITNLTDFDKVMRETLYGGGVIKAFSSNNILTKQWGSAMIHSILSGPKTPVRAAIGTGVTASSRMMAQVVGAGVRGLWTGDGQTFKEAVSSSSAMVQAIPEAWKVFTTKLNSYWSGELAGNTNRYIKYDPNDANWEAFGKWAYSRGHGGDQAAYNIANLARNMNSNKYFTYASKLLSATDDGFKVIMARARARQQAIRFAMDKKKAGTVLDAADRAAAEEQFYKGLLDSDGNVDINSDTFLKSAYEEVTLTTELDGFAMGLQTAFNRAPMLRPFFLFARTGVNGLALVGKNTPIVGALMTKQRAILSGTAENLADLQKYGINSMEDLATEKSLIIGRQTIGMAVTFMAAQAALNGDLRGNGSIDRQQRNTAMQNGWRAREARIGGQGGIWVSTDLLEPWGPILNAVADIADYSTLMGEQWTENKFKHVALIISEAVTSKSYLQGLQTFTDVFTNEPYQFAKVAGNIMNNTVPLAGIRNSIGAVISPMTRELNSDIWTSIRNRNKFLEPLAGKGGLPYKYNLLKYEALNDWDIVNRFYNMVSPIPINVDDTPGQRLLFESNYDMTTTVNRYDDISLKEHPEIRSRFAEEISKQNLGVQLNKLARRKDVQESVEKMKRDAQDPALEALDPMRYYVHNDLISNLFRDAKRQAWANIQSMPEVQKLIAERDKLKASGARTLNRTQQVESTILPYR